MVKIESISLSTLLVGLSFCIAAHAQDFDQQKQTSWHQWRGPNADGTSQNADPPIHWDEDTNIEWKVEVPGKGSSTPIVWQDKIFLLTSIPTDRVDADLPKPEDQPDRLFGIKHPNTFYKFNVLCLDRKTGKTIWSKTATEQVPHEGHHPDNNDASASPTTDGERLYAWFGSRGFYCYDLDGNKLWERNFGNLPMRRSFGEGSSPVVHQGRVVVTRDSDGDSYIVVLDAKTGAPIWRKERDEISAWATPLVIEHAGQTQVITNASKRVRSYDLETGDVIWECGGQVKNVTPGPVYANGLVYCTSGYQGSALFAIPIDSKGDITGTEKIAWSLNRATPYIASPILYRGQLYFNQSLNAILSCVDAKDGSSIIERTRMPDLARIYASPVAANDRIYYAGRQGRVLVMKHGKKLEVLASNKLDDGFDASPALIGKQLLLRGQKYLYSIREE